MKRKPKPKIVYIETSSYEWGRIREDLIRKIGKRDDFYNFYREVADAIRNHTTGAVSFKIPFPEKTAKWLRSEYELHEMNQPAGDTKAVSEAARRLRRLMASGEITED